MKQYFLGIEFGSTRIKAVLLDEKHAIVKSGDYTWKSSLENGVWTYHMEDVQEGLRTAIRHTRTTSGNASIAKENRFIARGLVIDYDKYRVYIDGRDAGLTQNEFKLVALLGRYAGRVLTYDYLIREIWGPNKAYDNQILRVNMANIRRKIEKNPAEPEYIFTEVGVGYRMIEGD